MDTTLPLFSYTGYIKDLIDRNFSSQHIIYAEQHTSLKKACALLQEHNISSLPIFDTIKRDFVGIVDITDICFFVAYSQAQSEEEKIKRGEEGAREERGGDNAGGREEGRYKDVDMGDLIAISPEGHLRWSFSPDSLVRDTMEAFSKGIHRALVREGDSMHYHIITQRDAVKYLYESKQYEPIFNSKLKNLPRLFEDKPKLVTIDWRTPAIEGFKKIGREHLGAVAVVDDDGSLVGSLCATDLQGVSDAELRNLFLPTNLFLKNLHSNNIPRPLTAHHDDTLAKTVDNIVRNNDHRVWMVDEQGNLTGVLTLSDICKVLWE